MKGRTLTGMGLFMKIKGIRILDTVNKIVSVELPDILEEIIDGDLYYWSILFFYGSGRLGEGRSIPLFEKEARESEKGILIGWDDLKILANKFDEVRDILIIGCKNPEMIIRYENDQIMYESCDIVIEMIDSGYWEVFSNDTNLINRLFSKFKDVRHLESDFQTMQ